MVDFGRAFRRGVRSGRNRVRHDWRNGHDEVRELGLEYVNWLRVVSCKWGIKSFKSGMPGVLDYEDVARHCENIVGIKGYVTWPPRELSVEVRAELSAFVRVESVPKFSISLCVCHVACTDEGVAEGQELLIIL